MVKKYGEVSLSILPMTPLAVNIGLHENIELLTYCIITTTFICPLPYHVSLLILLCKYRYIIGYWLGL